MFYVTSEIYLNNDLGSLAVSVDNYPQKRKNHLTITYMKLFSSFSIKVFVKSAFKSHVYRNMFPIVDAVWASFLMPTLFVL